MKLLRIEAEEDSVRPGESAAARADGWSGFGTPPPPEILALLPHSQN
jgi:hypothetical protein